MVNVFESFARWWNNLAIHNGKLKFKNQKEAAEFVRRAYNEKGGPNKEMLELHQKYMDVKRAQST